MKKKIFDEETLRKEQKLSLAMDILLFVSNFNPTIFRGRAGLKSLKDILLDYQQKLK